MKDNFMIPDDRLHKTRFCKKKGGGGVNQNFPDKEGGLERFCFLRGEVGQKDGGDFLRGGSYPGAHYAQKY